MAPLWLATGEGVAESVLLGEATVEAAAEVPEVDGAALDWGAGVAVKKSLGAHLRSVGSKTTHTARFLDFERTAGSVYITVVKRVHEDDLVTVRDFQSNIRN